MPASRKIYVPGSRPDILVPMREITLSGNEPSIRLYDTSGPYTDPDVHSDIKQGLSPLRLPWILGRADVEELPGPTSQYLRQRESDPALGGIRFASVRRPLRPFGRQTEGGLVLREACPHRRRREPERPRRPSSRSTENGRGTCRSSRDKTACRRPRRSSRPGRFHNRALCPCTGSGASGGL